MALRDKVGEELPPITAAGTEFVFRTQAWRDDKDKGPVHTISYKPHGSGPLLSITAASLRANMAPVIPSVDGLHVTAQVINGEDKQDDWPNGIGNVSLSLPCEVFPPTSPEAEERYLAIVAHVGSQAVDLMQAIDPYGFFRINEE